MNVIIVILLLFIVILLIEINNKLPRRPKRDPGIEALKRDLRARRKQEQEDHN
ncbi:hypothetical protein SAMN05518855_100329 [Paenibacillus sp. CF384]|nr:hypothetical protein SAMN05518855_100329 [Paenibacillus sp. CF384]